ncbi:hypothetical protein KCU81_g7203, partial [Aureobasidium melanogenum]|uniref:PA14 domain-containing protein n=1 Tax=Aureobasidium melanogenum (strain CBS 110374) TaxID=1043003 RepID=A0A074VE73_AURM1
MFRSYIKQDRKFPKSSRSNVTSSTYITGTPTCATCSTPVTELVPPSSTPIPVPSGACRLSSSCGLGALTVQEINNTLLVAGAYGSKTGDEGPAPDYYLTENLTPLNVGTTTNMSIPSLVGDNSDVEMLDDGSGGIIYYYPDAVGTYAGFDFNPNNFTIVWTGYFAPQVSGSYQFCMNYADNRQAFYIGSDNAFPCGDSANAATPTNATAFQDYWFDNPTLFLSVCQNMTLTAGFYYPIRAVYGNNGLPASSNFTVSGPGLGTNVTDLSGLIAPATCS